MAPDLIGNEEGGRFVEHNDVERLADAVLELVDDSNLRRELGNHCRAKANDYSVARMARAYESLYMSVCD